MKVEFFKGLGSEDLLLSFSRSVHSDSKINWEDAAKRCLDAVGFYAPMRFYTALLAEAKSRLEQGEQPCPGGDHQPTR
jgi:hypothetical protein